MKSSFKTLIFLAVMSAALSSQGACVGEGTLEEVDPAAAPDSPTWTEHIQPMMERRCTACHAPDAQNGQEEGLGYETCEKVRRNWGGLEETVFVEDSMPPAGAYRVTESERLTLRRWHNQGAPCP